MLSLDALTTMRLSRTRQRPFLFVVVYWIGRHDLEVVWFSEEPRFSKFFLSFFAHSATEWIMRFLKVGEMW